MTAPADGGALPTANLNRRLLLTGLASLPAIAGAGSALASQAVETPDERAVRLAHELSEAMNGFMTPAGDKPGWVAHVKPSAYPGPISFSQDARPENHPDRELLALGAEFEHRWATERATSKAMSGIYTKKADKLVNQAMAHTGEIVERIIAKPALTSEGYRLLAKAYLWCRGDDPGTKLTVRHAPAVTTDDKVLMTAALAGCETQTEGQQRATTGALIGGAGGALVGQAIGGNTKSTVIGAASGALLGAVVGSATTPQRRGEQLCRYRDRYGQIYTAPCDDRYYNGDY